MFPKSESQHTVEYSQVNRNITTSFIYNNVALEANKGLTLNRLCNISSSHYQVVLKQNRK